MRQNNILAKLEQTVHHDRQIYNELLEKLEVAWLRRFKKTARQRIRRYLAIGVSGLFGQLTANELIRKINSPSQKRKVVFVTGYPTFNLSTMSIGLRRTGQFETVLLTQSPWLADVTQRCFDIVHVYDSYYSVAKILSQIQPYLVHVQGGINYYFFAIIARALCKAPVVMGFYDIPTFGLTKDQWTRMWGKTDAKLDFFTERFAFETMDGIVLAVHCLEAGKILSRKYGSVTPMIDFPAYVCEEFITSPEPRYSQGDGRIRLVYGGHVSPSNLPKEMFGDVQFQPLIEKLTTQGIQFEMYPTPYMSPIRVRQIFADYVKLSRNNPLFNYHVNVAFDDAMQQASRCDFGSMIYLFEKCCYGQEHTRLVIPTKFFKFLEAGLPVIVSEEAQYISKLVKDHEIGIVVSQKDIDNLSEIIKSYNYKELKANVKEAQKRLSVKRHIRRLIDFYAQVLVASSKAKPLGMAVALYKSKIL